MKREGKRRVRASTLRVLSALGVAALVCLGLALHTGTGTPSSFGIADIAALCPLGGIEAAIASRTVVPPLLIGLAVVVALTLLLGRAFCAWGCPVPLLRRVFRGKKASKRDASSPDSGPLDVPASERGGLRDSRNWVLGGAILSTCGGCSSSTRSPGRFWCFRPCSCWSWQCCGNGAIGSVRWERCCRWCRAATARSGRRRTSGRACMRLTASAAIGAPTRARKASTCMIGRLPLRSTSA